MQVFSDHQNLEYFTMTKVLNQRQARWAQELADIDFRIYYRPRTQNGKPDALSRCSEYCPGKDGIENQPVTTVLQEKHLAERQTRSFIMSSARLTSLPSWKWNKEFVEQICRKAKEDPVYQRSWEAAKTETEDTHQSKEQWTNRKNGNKILEIQDELLYRKNMLWVPNDKELIQATLESEHDTKVAEYMDQDKTIELIRRNFWQPNMDEQIIDFV